MKILFRLSTQVEVECRLNGYGDGKDIGFIVEVSCKYCTDLRIPAFDTEHSYVRHDLKACPWLY
jgi:hypothetical protein